MRQKVGGKSRVAVMKQTKFDSENRNLSMLSKINAISVRMDSQKCSFYRRYDDFVKLAGSQ